MTTFPATSSNVNGKAAHSLNLRLQLRKIQESQQVKSKAKEVLKLALGRSLIEETDRRHARVAESDIIFFRFIFFQLFEVNAQLDWRDKPIRFSAHGWRHTWHDEIRERTGLSPDELRRKMTRFTKLGFIETAHRQREDSVKLNGLYVRPFPARVWELLNRLDDAKKIEKENHQKPSYHDPLVNVAFLAEGPATPAWLRERELAWRLLYQSNFRSVLPAAIRYGKTGDRSRRRIRDRRKAGVADGFIKFALGMCALFGVDEFRRLCDSGHCFDEEGNRMVSPAKILRITKCSPKEARDAADFYKKFGIYQTFFKTGVRYTKLPGRVKRVTWQGGHFPGSWTFCDFREVSSKSKMSQCALSFWTRTKIAQKRLLSVSRLRGIQRDRSLCSWSYQMPSMRKSW